MAQIGNKINSFLNGEWAKHVRWFGKRETAGIRRMESKEIIRKETSLNEDGLLVEMEVLLDSHDNDLLLYTDEEISKLERAENVSTRYPINELLKAA